MSDAYTLRHVNSVLRMKIKEQQAYIADLEEKLGIVGQKEAELVNKIKDLAAEAKNKRKTKRIKFKVMRKGEAIDKAEEM